MKTIEIKQRLGEEILDQLKRAQKDYYVQSTENVINELKQALRPPVVSHQLLRELRQIYLVDVDNDGQPKASISEIMDLWDRVNRELQIVTID